MIENPIENPLIKEFERATYLMGLNKREIDHIKMFVDIGKITDVTLKSTFTKRSKNHYLHLQKFIAKHKSTLFHFKKGNQTLVIQTRP